MSAEKERGKLLQKELAANLTQLEELIRDPEFVAKASAICEQSNLSAARCAEVFNDLFQRVMLPSPPSDIKRDHERRRGNNGSGKAKTEKREEREGESGEAESGNNICPRHLLSPCVIHNELVGDGGDN